MNVGMVCGLIKAMAPGIDPADVEQAVSDWLNAHPEATTTVQDGSITEAKLAQDVLAELGEIEGLKEAIGKQEGEINEVKAELYDFSEIAVDATALNWRLNESNGLCSSASGYKMVKYKVTAGQTVKVVSDDRFQFQTVASVPSSGTSNRVGVTYGSGTFVLTVPDTATYLIVSTTSTGSTAAAYVGASKFESIEAEITGVENEIEQKTDFVTFITDPDFEDKTNIIADTTWQEGYYRGTNGNATTSQYTTNYICSDFIPVNPGEKYRLYVNGTCGIYAEYYSNAKNDGTEVSLGTVSGSGSHVDITVPDGKTFLALNCSLNHSNRVNVIHRLTQYDSEKAICFPRLVYGTQEWIGKKIVNLGDSCFANGVTTGNDISAFIAKDNGATVYNCAFGGCRMGYHPYAQYDAFSMYKLADAIATGTWTEQDAVAVYEDVPSYFATTLAVLKAIDFSEVDIVTISYGTNDFTGGIGIGGDTKYYADWALKYSIETLLTAFPNLRIFVCMPMYRVWLTEQHEFDEDSNTKECTATLAGGASNKLTDFVEAERNVCKGLQIPVLDTYYDLGINKWNWTTYFPATDGTHQNETGRKLIAEYIASKLW